MNIKLTPVNIKDKNKLGDMLRVYQTEMFEKDMGKYKYLDSYWKNPRRFPFFVMIDSDIAGLVLINDYTIILDKGNSISEFYISKDFREKGVGKEAARLAFNMFPRKWELRELKNNKGAHSFWNTIISGFTNNKYTEVYTDDDKWDGWIITFDMNGKLFPKTF